MSAELYIASFREHGGPLSSTPYTHLTPRFCDTWGQSYDPPPRGSRGTPGVSSLGPGVCGLCRGCGVGLPGRPCTPTLEFPYLGIAAEPSFPAG